MPGALQTFNILNPYGSLVREMLLAPCFREGDQHSKGLSNFPKVTQFALAGTKSLGS